MNVVLLTHAHLDHAGAVPLLFKMGYRGPIVMSRATHRSCLHVWAVYVSGNIKPLYENEHIRMALDATIFVQPRQTILVNEVEITAWDAGHILGSLSFLARYKGKSVLFSGDFFKPDIPMHVNPDILITEATYGGVVHDCPKRRFARLLDQIRSTLMQGGNVLIPTRALAARELMKMIVDYFVRLSLPFPIYKTRGMDAPDIGGDVGVELRDVEEEYSEFPGVSDLPANPVEPMVLLAAPANMEHGVSKEWLEKWQDDERNLVVICGYYAPGTIASKLVLGKHKIRVFETGMALHADTKGILNFINNIRPRAIVFVHYNGHKMQMLLDIVKSRGYPCYCPVNGNVISIDARDNFAAHADQEHIYESHIINLQQVKDEVERDYRKVISHMKPLECVNVSGFLAWKEPPPTSDDVGYLHFGPTVPNLDPFKLST